MISARQPVLTAPATASPLCGGKKPFLPIHLPLIFFRKGWNLVRGVFWPGEKDHFVAKNTQNYVIFLSGEIKQNMIYSKVW